MKMKKTILAALFSVATIVIAQTPDYARIRAEQARDLTQPYGWFSLIALESLKPGDTTVGSAAGNAVVLAGAPAHLVTLQQKNGIVTITSSAPSLLLHNKPVSPGTVVSSGEDKNSALINGSVHFWAIERGGNRYLRVKDSNAPALKHFHGLNWYPPDAHFRIEARWIPFSSPHTMKVMNKLGQITPVPVPGYVEFELNGQKVTLTPMTADANDLWFVFRDATFLHTTDGGGRFLYTGGPSNGVDRPGSVILDFNLAENPPCAYSPYATCPLASPENRLQIPILAGEKRYDN